MNHTRREFLRAGVVLGASALGASLAARGLAASTPNIIFILADDLGFGDLGCYGQQVIQTPHIDRMAAEGLRFNQHYAGTSVCAPSRCSLMTGLHTGHAFIRGNTEANPYGQLPLSKGATTVARLLRQAGYRCGLIGKWGLGVENTVGDPIRHGFDEFYGYYCQVHAHNSFPEYLYRNGRKEPLRNQVTYMPADHWTRGLGSYATKKVDYTNDLFCKEGLQFIEGHRERPFFLLLAFTIPHNNGEAPEGERLESPTQEPYADRSWSPEARRYAAMITRMDRYVGSILEKLTSLGIERRSLVLFSSDNGPEVPLFDVFRSNGQFRGTKRDLYEGGIRVPLIAWWPGTIRAGKTSDHVSAFWDFLPTSCVLAGVAPLPGSDGISFGPTLLGTGEQKNHDCLYWELHERGGKQAVRAGRWKAVRLAVDSNANAPIQLFDLLDDPREEVDVAGRHERIVARMVELMRWEHARSVEFPFAFER